MPESRETEKMVSFRVEAARVDEIAEMVNVIKPTYVSDSWALKTAAEFEFEENPKNDPMIQRVWIKYGQTMSCFFREQSETLLIPVFLAMMGIVATTILLMNHHFYQSDTMLPIVTICMAMIAYITVHVIETLLSTVHLNLELHDPNFDKYIPAKMDMLLKLTLLLATLEVVSNVFQHSYKQNGWSGTLSWGVVILITGVFPLGTMGYQCAKLYFPLITILIVGFAFRMVEMRSHQDTCWTYGLDNAYAYTRWLAPLYQEAMMHYMLVSALTGIVCYVRMHTITSVLVHTSKTTKLDMGVHRLHLNNRSIFLGLLTSILLMNAVFIVILRIIGYGGVLPIDICGKGKFCADHLLMAQLDNEIVSRCFQKHFEVCYAQNKHPNYHGPFMKGKYWEIVTMKVNNMPMMADVLDTVQKWTYTNHQYTKDLFDGNSLSMNELLGCIAYNFNFNTTEPSECAEFTDQSKYKYRSTPSKINGGWSMEGLNSVMRDGDNIDAMNFMLAGEINKAAEIVHERPQTKYEPWGLKFINLAIEIGRIYNH
jgi:hypothetical protein